MACSERADDGGRRRRTRASAIKVLGLLAALVLLGGVAWLGLRPKPRAYRLLVVLRTETLDGKSGAWWLPTGGRASARCADKLQERLGALGFEVVPAGSPEVGKRLAERATVEELRDGARTLDAALVLVGRLRIVAATPLPGSDGQSDYAVELEAELRSSAEPATQPLALPPPRWYLPATDEESALLAACDALPARVAPLVADAWLELPVVATALAREARRRSLDERVAFERLAPALELARRGRDARAARAKVERERRDQDGRQEQGQLRKHLLGSFFAEEYWVGAGPEQDVVLMALPALDRLAEDGTARFERQAEHEQLLRARADGSERRPLLETYNIFSFPSVSANGARVAAVLDHRQWSKSIAVLDVGDGRVREVVNHRSHYFSSPILAPDGSALLFWSSVGRDGEPSLERAAADGSGRRTLVPAPFIRMDVPAWSADGQSVYLSLQAQDEQRSSLWRLDPSTGERALLLGGADAATASSWLRPTPTPDGRELVLVEQDDSVSPSVTWVGSFALPSGPYRRLVQLAVGRMAVSPDSRQLACETSPTSDPDDPRADDTELALVPLGGGEPRLLTRNRIDDSLAGWSRDGRKLYLHQRDAELEGGRASHRIYWLEP